MSLNNQSCWITGAWISKVPLNLLKNPIVCYTVLPWLPSSHGSIPLVVPGSCGVWIDDGYLVIVGLQAMSVSVGVRQ